MSHTTVNTEVGEFINDCIVARDRINLPTYSSAPAVHDEGSLYYDTTLNNTFQSDGSTWSGIGVEKFARHITVAQSGGDYSDLNSAVTASIAMTPTSSSPVQIQIYPGTYNFANPLVVPSYVLITSLADTANSVVKLIGTTAGINGFEMSAESSLDGLTITNAILGITCLGGTVRVSNCILLNTLLGLQSLAGSICVADSCTVMATSGFSVTGFQAITAGMIFGTDLYVRAMGGTVSTGYRCDGAGSKMFLDNCNAIGATISSVTSNGGFISYNAGRSLNSTSVAHSVQGSTLSMIGHEVAGTGEHLTIDATGVVYVQACRLRGDRITMTPTSVLSGNYFSETPGDEGMRIEGELSVGNVLRPAEAVFGEGDSYTTGMVVYDGVSTGPLDDGTLGTNITSDVALIGDGNTSPAFPALTTNSTLYIASEYASFQGIKITITSGMVSPSTVGSEAFLEYWDGSTWVAVNMMSTDATSPYLPHAGDRFNVGTFQYRFGITNAMVVKTMGATTGYWCRYRLTSGITTDAVIDQIKIHSNRLEINRDGFVELFGTAQLTLEYPYDINTAAPSIESPANQDLYIDKGISVGRRENAFQDATTDRLGFDFNLPSNTDTSRPLKFVMRYFVTSNTSGVAQFEVRGSKSADFADDPGPLSDIYESDFASPVSSAGLISDDPLPITIAVGTSRKIQSVKFEIDISSLVLRRITGSELGDMLTFTLVRLGNDPADTFGFSINIISLTPSYTVWSNGTPL